ncbi:MAG: type III-A CRISPR-associated RAMP protein Csm5 [Methanobrevibacter sp.]|jgi:CRISPR type III-A-associated RAMP protein Csm5|nr:type III-A CRISPR-associated RAMP protein Csm5 [Methanobrevibacter sp.]
MGSNIKSYKCRLQTLSPVHIGSGKTFSSSEYLPFKVKVRNKKLNEEEIRNKIRRINFDKYFMSLSDSKKDDFIEYISEYSSNLKDFDKKISNEYKRYELTNQSKAYYPKEIKEHIKTMDELYIPGSSLKGAIKTALFYDNINRSDISNIHRLIKRGSRGKFIPRMSREYSEFIDKVFSSQNGARAAQYNISKFLQISDSSTAKNGAIYEAITIKAKKPNPPNLGGFEPHKVRGNLASSYLETIDKKNLLDVKITTNYDDEVYKALRLNQNQENMLSMTYIKKCLYNLSRDFIDYELSFLDRYKDTKLERFYLQLSKLNKKETPLVKIGSGSGYMATTIGMKIKELDPNLFEEIRETFRRSYEYEFPKSRKLISPSHWSFGWVKFSIKEE